MTRASWSASSSFRQSLGLAVTRLRPSEARDREPALAPTVRLALEAPDDHSVDPRLVLVALRQACELGGVQLREHAPVARVELDGAGARAIGVRLHDGERVAAGKVVLAAGPWSERDRGPARRARVPVRPVKGQLLRLRDPAGPGLLRRVVRFDGGYVVPRGDGRYVLGATVEERGFELAPTAGGVYEMLREAHELLPGDQRAGDRGAVGGAAPGHAGQRARDRSGSGRGADLGDGPLPQRHPAGAADGASWWWVCSQGEHGGARRPRSLRSACAPERFADGGGVRVIVLNGRALGRARRRDGGAALARLGLDIDARGVAVAVDGEVVPRAAWESFALSEDARVEVLTAMQGG